MASKVYITGFGIISALGNGIDANLHALVNGKTGIDFPQFLNTVHKSSFVTGEVKLSNNALAEEGGIKQNHLISRTALLGLVAAREAVENANLEGEILKNTGFINGTSVGGMDISEQYYRQFIEGADLNYKEIFSGHDCGFSTEFIAQHLKINGHLSTISTACSSSANAIMQAARLIKAGKCECVIAGGTDALSLFTLNGFNALKILDPKLCKPFDSARQGLNLGEGAAYLVLESEAQANKRKAPKLAELIGYGNANDAYHQTASSPEGKGAFMAMKKALEISLIEDIKKIDYVNAHGTGTANNDLSESVALQLVFGEDIPDYSSTKSFTGHTLGAAGGIEAVFSVLAINKGLKFPNLNLSEPMNEIAKQPLRNIKTDVPVSCVVSNSFGFGGNCTSLIFSK